MNVSASQLAEITEAYKCFPPAWPASGYACNAHAQVFKRSLAQNNFPAEWVDEVNTHLSTCELAPCHQGQVKEGETAYSDPQLWTVLEAVVKVVNMALGDNDPLAVKVATGGEAAKYYDFVLATPGSKPEPVLWCANKAAYVVASEAKAPAASVYSAHTQVFQATGDGALELHRRGLALDECIVFGVVCAGGMVQVVASYLLPYYYPCMAAVTDPMSYVDPGHRAALVSALCALAEAAAASVKRLADANLPVTRVRTPGPAMLLAGPELFLKPVEAIECDVRGAPQGAHQCAAASRVLHTFELLDRGGALRFACSPLGMVSLPPESAAHVTGREKMMDCLGHRSMPGVF